MLKKLFIAVLILLLMRCSHQLFLSDAERLKTELAIQLTAASGYQVDIQGQLDWQVIPSLGVAVTNIKLRDGETQIHIGKLRVGLSLSELAKSPEAWTLGSLIMDEVRLKDAGFRVQRFALQNFVLGQAAPFQAQILMLEGSEPSTVKADSAPTDMVGDLIYQLNTSRSDPNTTLSDVQLLKTAVQTQWGGEPLSAVCSGELQELDGVSAKDSENLLNTYTGNMDCTSSEFTINHLSWPDSQVMIELKNRRLMAAMLAKNGTVNVSKLKKTISTISAMGGKEDPLGMAGCHGISGPKRRCLTVRRASDCQYGVRLQGTLDGTPKSTSMARRYRATETLIRWIAAGRLPCHTVRLQGFRLRPDTEKAISIAGDLMKREGKRRLRDEAERKLLESLEDKLPDNLKESAKQLLNLFN